MAISNKMSILGTKKAVAAYNGGYYLPSVSDEGILSWSPTVEGMAPIPEVNVRGPQGPQGSDASVTAEAVQAVAPIAWDETSVTLGEGTTNPGRNTIIGAKIKGYGERNTLVGAESYSQSSYGTATGYKARTGYNGSSVGYDAQSAGNEAIAIGCSSRANNHPSMAIGSSTEASASYSTALGYRVKTKSPNALTIGSLFYETVDGTTVTHTCTTEGTGSITIGAGANTKNNGDVESSNSVTIGCKAENKGADSVTLGASASNTAAGSVAIGAKAQASGLSVSVGRNSRTAYTGTAVGAHASTSNGVSVGFNSYATSIAVAIGYACQAKAENSIVLGTNASVSDYGATVIRSTAEDGTYTQLYFSGANTPLANRYFPTAWEQKQDVDPETNEPLFDDNGDPVMVDDKDKPIAGDAMMGFVTVKNGEIIARGANMLSALFPYYTGDDENPFAPTTMSLRPGDEPQEVMVFHPSDLDLPVEEPEEMEEPEVGESEPAKYVPLPVYPIVEPEIEEI